MFKLISLGTLYLTSPITTVLSSQSSYSSQNNLPAYLEKWIENTKTGIKDFEKGGKFRVNFENFLRKTIGGSHLIQKDFKKMDGFENGNIPSLSDVSKFFLNGNVFHSGLDLINDENLNNFIHFLRSVKLLNKTKNYSKILNKIIESDNSYKGLEDKYENLYENLEEKVGNLDKQYEMLLDNQNRHMKNILNWDSFELSNFERKFNDITWNNGTKYLTNWIEHNVEDFQFKILDNADLNNINYEEILGNPAIMGPLAKTFSKIDLFQKGLLGSSGGVAFLIGLMTLALVIRLRKTKAKRKIIIFTGATSFVLFAAAASAIAMAFL